MSKLQPTSYHRNVRKALETHEPGLWQWFASDQFTRDATERMRLELLKATYRLDPASHADVYALAREAAVALGLESLPVTLYQTDGSANAAVLYAPDAIQVVFSGPVLTRLSSEELRALLGHELAHYKLWTDEGGVYRCCNAMAEWIAEADRAPASWRQLAVRLRHYTEIYADRGALIAAGGDLQAVLRCLLKTSVGIEKPDVTAYLKQVDEVLNASADATEGVTHPEMFIRAWALKRWSEAPEGVDAELVARIEGPLTPETLDVLGQHTLTAQTRALIEGYLQTCSTESALAAARGFFPDIAAKTSALDAVAPSLHDYLSYVLLDLATSDADSRDGLLAGALVYAEAHGFDDRLSALMRSELKMKAGDVNDLRERWTKLREAMRS